MSLKVFAGGHEIPLSTFVFPGGEVSVKIGVISTPSVSIQAILKTSDDIMKLLMLTDAIRRLNPEIEIHLEMPYVPYARQDRVMVPGESLSIKVFCGLINVQDYTSVTIWDPHSDVTPALLNNCIVKTQAMVMSYQLPFGETHKTLGSSWGRADNIYKTFVDNTVLVAPDAGAMKKIHESSQVLGFKDIVRADKVRDPATGKILETVVYSEHIGDKNFLIVDDICDGGRTFLELAKVLRPLTNGKIILYVTHGIFSANLGVFKDIIDEVYCANSFEQYAPHVNLAGVQKDNGHYGKF